MIGWQETRSLLEKTLGFSSADETEATLLGRDEGLTRYANNVIHQHVAETNRYLIVRAVVGRSVGVAVTNDLTDEGLEHVVEQATRIANQRPEQPDFPGLPAPVPVPEVEAFDETTAAYSPLDRAGPVVELCGLAQAQSCIASGAFRTGVREYGVANSRGVLVYHPVTIADLTTVVMTADSSGFATDASWQVDQMDVVALGREAIDKARRSRDPQSLEPGVYPVVLEPYATHDLLATLSLAAGATFVQEGRSWMSGRQGESLMSPQVSIWDDGLDPRGWPLPFDCEGIPRRRVDVVRQGVVSDVVYDRERALEDEAAESTGHALPAANPFNPWLNAARFGPIPLHVFMATGESSLEEMVAEIDRGLYVTRFWYTRTVHPREAVVTGMTRDGTFLIEDGELAGPVRNLRFTQSYTEALAGVKAVGRELRRVWNDPGIISAPALRLDAFDFTGATEF